MELSPISTVPLDSDRLAQAFPTRGGDRPITDAANDISIANRLGGATLRPDDRERRIRARIPRIEDLAEILKRTG